MAAIGRPSDYTEEQGNEVCRLIEVGKSLGEIEEELDVTKPKLFRWLESNEGFRNRYALARANQADTYDSQISENVKLMLEGKITTEQCRVANDALKWQAGKRKPTVYGDKLALTDTKGLTINIVRSDTPALSASNEPSLDAEFEVLE